MKKNRMMRLASILLVCVLLTTSVISGTFAKYTSDANAEDTARVAKWEIIYTNETDALDGIDITGTDEEISFNLFKTVMDSDGTSTETNVKTGSGNEVIIAPGTSGSFKMKVENKSEVDAKYTLKLEETKNDGIYIQYKLADGDWADDFSAINAKKTDVDIAMENGSEEITVYWRWVFDNEIGDKDGHAGQTNANDTALGASFQDGVKEVTVKASLTVTQVD